MRDLVGRMLAPVCAVDRLRILADLFSKWLARSFGPASDASVGREGRVLNVLYGLSAASFNVPARLPLAPQILVSEWTNPGQPLPWTRILFHSHLSLGGVL
jgi:hypothetical protein